jgi:hypothetical protein
VNVVRDRIARRAAALFAAGGEPDIHRAIRRAAETLGFAHDARLPSEGEVRRHLQGMAQEAMGAEAYDEEVAETLGLAAQCMETLERAFGGPTLLAGRGARGQFDGGAELHLRLYARAELPDIARVLAELGMEEPSFETVETLHGRANRVRTAIDGVVVTVLRCLPEWWGDRARDLVTGKPASLRTLEELQRMQ